LLINFFYNILTLGRCGKTDHCTCCA